MTTNDDPDQFPDDLPNNVIHISNWTPRERACDIPEDDFDLCADPWVPKLIEIYNYDDIFHVSDPSAPWNQHILMIERKGVKESRWHYWLDKKIFFGEYSISDAVGFVITLACIPLLILPFPIQAIFCVSMFGAESIFYKFSVLIWALFGLCAAWFLWLGLCYLITWAIFRKRDMGKANTLAGFTLFICFIGLMVYGCMNRQTHYYYDDRDYQYELDGHGTSWQPY